jgi:hypothetical protein
VGAKLQKYNIEPFVGITSTPVIDLGTNMMFVVAKIAKPGPVQVDCDGEVAIPKCPVDYWIFALNLRNGDIQKSLKISLPPPEPTQIHPAKGKFCSGYRDRATEHLLSTFASVFSGGVFGLSDTERARDSVRGHLPGWR